jgi:predicted DNA binding CopG/RHH family protein
MNPEMSRSRGTSWSQDSEVFLGKEIEDLKEMLLEHDRSLADKLSRGEKRSLQDRRARSSIIRRLNRARRELSRLRAGNASQPLRRITFRVSQSDYERLQIMAEQNGMSLATYIRNQLLPEE